MARILIIGTASPKRICRKVEQILADPLYPEPDITILCRKVDDGAFAHFPGVTLVHQLPEGRFDAVFCFWTGEGRFWAWKLLPLRLWSQPVYIDAGDGNEYRLTWKAICVHTLFRIRHPLPSDHYEHLPSGARILIVQSAEPPFVLRAMDRLERNAFFKEPQISLFCRNKPEIESSFRNHPMLHEIITHSETRGSWNHLRALRRRHFDALVLFLTGDPSYWKVKLFAFLLGAKTILIFNEENDCFFFNFRQWIALLAHRCRTAVHPDMGSRWSQSGRVLLSLVLKSVALPFRFCWLLLVWLRLRYAGIRKSRESHDYSS